MCLQGKGYKGLIIWQPPAARKRQGKILPYSLQREQDPINTDLGLLASGTEREYISVKALHLQELVLEALGSWSREGALFLELGTGYRGTSIL